MVGSSDPAIVGKMIRCVMRRLLEIAMARDKTCGVGDDYLVIDHRGNVAKCQMWTWKAMTEKNVSLIHLLVEAPS